jgi:hypothetical protein
MSMFCGECVRLFMVSMGMGTLISCDTCRCAKIGFSVARMLFICVNCPLV